MVSMDSVADEVAASFLGIEYSARRLVEHLSSCELLANGDGSELTVVAHGISIDTVDICLTKPCTWREASNSEVIVEYKGNDNASLSKLVFHVRHILSLR